jgi:hypothetical protein
MHAIDRLFSFAIAFHRLIVTTMRCANQYVDAPMVVDGCVNRRNAAAVLKPRWQAPAVSHSPLFHVLMLSFEQTKKAA